MFLDVYDFLFKTVDPNLPSFLRVGGRLMTASRWYQSWWAKTISSFGLDPAHHFLRGADSCLNRCERGHAVLGRA